MKRTREATRSNMQSSWLPDSRLPFWLFFCFLNGKQWNITRRSSITFNALYGLQNEPLSRMTRLPIPEMLTRSFFFVFFMLHNLPFAELIELINPKSAIRLSKYFLRTMVGCDVCVCFWRNNFFFVWISNWMQSKVCTSLLLPFLFFFNFFSVVWERKKFFLSLNHILILE